jgi:terpene synthase-like protein
VSRSDFCVPQSILDVPIPFPSYISPDVPRARARHLAWVSALDLWPTADAKKAYQAADFPLFVGHTHPWAVGEDLDLVTDLIGWSWLWDDSLDRPGPRQASPARVRIRLDAYRGAMAGRASNCVEAPLVVAWRQLLDRLAERTFDAWRERHLRHWEATFDAYLHEAENNSLGIVPSLDEYLPMRRSAGGMDICLDWVEAAGRYELPAHLHASPEILALRRDEQDVVAMTNDLFSARNEWDSGNTDNIVHVIAQQEGCPWEKAASQVRTLIASALQDFSETEQRLWSTPTFMSLPPAVQADTRQFVDAMKAWMRGSLEWHLTSPRYR